ncbi:hypothetical protein EDD11_001315 [Mortierella claussenii]|nr:hypothetical protein EDD11_001315 [Mortierella claussenii]
MPFFSASTPVSAAAAAAAAASSRLPRFLRPESMSARIEVQHQLFTQLNLHERQRLQSAYSPDSPFSVRQAALASTRDLNRYTDIVPYKHSQVLVGSNISTNSTITAQQLAQTFINANRITPPPSLQSSLAPDFRGYIATQAPLPHTQPQFWRMVQEQNVHVIVCLTAVSQDRSRRAQKAERYWPLAGETDQFDPNLHVRNLDRVDDQDQVAYRHLELWDPTNSAVERRQILLVHYQGWPDHGVPVTTDDLRDILYNIRAWKKEQRQQQSRKDFGPTLVHCSAGCGRTGTFCVIDTALSVLEHTQYPYLAPSPRGLDPTATRLEDEQAEMPTFSSSSSSSLSSSSSSSPLSADAYNFQSDRDLIYESLSSFREERMLMVQTASQYSFCYRAVQDLCK